MADLQFYINNNLVPEPQDWQGLELELEFTNDSPAASIKTTTFTWLGSDAFELNKWVRAGLYGGVGIFEGIPFKIMACGLVVFDGVIDMTSQDTTFQCDIVKASVKETNRVQFLNDRAESFTFAYLASAASGDVNGYTGAGHITLNDYIHVPYVLSNVPDWFQVVNFIVTFIGMVKLVRDAVSGIVQNAEAAAAATLPWLVIVFIAMAAAWLVIALILTKLAVNVMEMIINEMIQPIKFKKCMRVSTLFTKACDYLGLQFSSTILQHGTYKNLVIMPAKNAYFNNTVLNDVKLSTVVSDALNQFDINRKIYDDACNDLSYGYYDGTFASLIRDMEDVFNAKVLIRDNTLYFERWDYWSGLANFTLPNISKDAPFDNPYGTNAFELASNYEVIFKTDTQDTNTLDKYDGTSCQMTLEPLITNIQKNVLLKNLTQKNLNFALAKRKTSLTGPEHTVNAVLGMMNGNTITNAFIAAVAMTGIVAPIWDAWQNMPLPIDDPSHRIGDLLLSSDLTSVPKLFVVKEETIYLVSQNDTRVVANQIDESNNITDGPNQHQGYTDAYYLSKWFHSSSWAVSELPFNNYMTGNIDTPPSYPNQYLTYKENEIPLCCSDFVVLKDNNIVKTFDGKLGRAISIRWNPFNETAVIDFSINQVYTKNITQKIIIDGNQ